MRAVFDEHNDVLTREDHHGLVAGRAGGHLDLPRMARGGLRGGVFAVFSPSPQDTWASAVPAADGTLEVGLAEPISPAFAAGHATPAAGRGLAAERVGHVRVARRIEDVDAALAVADGPPVAVLHLEGAEAIDPELEDLDVRHAAGLRSLGPVWSRANTFASGVPFHFPGLPDVRPGLTEAGVRLVGRCAELGILVDLAHLAQPDRRAARRVRQRQVRTIAPSSTVTGKRLSGTALPSASNALE